MLWTYLTKKVVYVGFFFKLPVNQV